MRPTLALLLPAFLAAQAPAPLPPGDWPGLQSRLAEAAKADRFSGVVYGVREDQVLVQGAYGLARRGDALPNTLATRFNLASLGKMFTAVAIGQLADQGKLSFEDPILKYLPEYKSQPGWDKVRVKHLLSHTAGFGTYWGPGFDARRADIRAVKDYFPLFLGKPLAFEPGSRWEYSNVGFILLGAIVEKASGEDYFSYIQKHIFDPAGMKDSGFFELDHDTPRLATGYLHPRDEEGRQLSSEWLNNTLMEVAKGGPAGGGYATAPDLARFAEALMGGRLLKPETFRAMTTPHAVIPGPPGAPMTLSYGYGFGIEQRGGQTLVGHNGGAPGDATDLLMEPATGRVLVLLSNLDPADLGPAPQWLRQAFAAPPVK